MSHSEMNGSRSRYLNAMKVKELKVNRRWFLQTAGVAGAAVLLAACGGQAASTASGSPAAKGSSSAAAKASGSPAAKAATGSAAPKASSQPDVPDALAALKDLPQAEREKRLLEEAKKEGKVTAYVTGSQDSWEAWKQAYEKKYGVSFDFLRSGSDELLDKTLTEFRAKKLVPDIVENGKMFILVDEGVVVPYTSPAKEAMPKKFIDRYMAQYDINPIVISYNTNMVKAEDAPKTWEDLLDPKWKGGKIALDLIPDITMIGLYREWGEDKGRDFMKKLLAQELVPTRSHTTATDQMAAGEFPIVAETYGYYAVAQKKKGAPIGYNLPDPMPTTAGGLAITSTTKKPHAAALLYDWMMSSEAGTIYAKFGRMPVQPGTQLQYPDLQKPILDSPNLKGLNVDDYRKWFPVVQKDIKDIVQPAMGGGH